MAEFPDSDKPNITSREHLRRHYRLARQQAVLRQARALVWVTMIGTIVLAIFFSTRTPLWFFAVLVVTAWATMLLERHLVHRYLIETMADEITWLTVLANPGHSAGRYAITLATLPAHEIQKALNRLEDAERVRVERIDLDGHPTDVYYTRHG